MGRLSLFLPLAAFVVLAGVFFFYLNMIRTGERVINVVPSALIDKPVPAFALPGLPDHPGGGFTSASFGGKVTAVNVFASWCIPCRAEHPVVESLAQMNVATVYGLNWKDKPAAAMKWLAELGDPYAAVGSDESGRAGIEWGVYGVPETYVVGPDAIIRYRHVGPMTPYVLENKILPLIRDLKGEG